MKNENGINVPAPLLTVKRVKDIYFNIKEILYVPEINKIIRTKLIHRIGFNTQLNLINFTLTLHFHYSDSPQNIFIEISIENIFEVPSLKDYEDENKYIILPKKLITLIVDISLSHSRALLFKNTGGTVFEDVTLPIRDAEEMAATFFPLLFKEAKENKQNDIEEIETDKKNRKIAKVHSG